MTLIVSLGNREQFIQLSDRRLNINGMLTDDESNKAGVFLCNNGRLAYGFTGLARIGSFETNIWLAEALMACGPPDYTAVNIINRLVEKATYDFENLPILNKLPKSKKKLTIMFSGYLYQHSTSLPVQAMLTNFQDFDKRSDDPCAWDRFKSWFWFPLSQNDEEITLVQRVGCWRVMSDEDAALLRPMLQASQPAKAILSKAIHMMTQMAEHPAAGGTIGKKISSIILPRDRMLPSEGGYHSDEISHKTYMPDMVTVTNTGENIVRGISIEAVDPATTPPIVVPKAGRNHPCPCKSGKKYKRCHGR